MNIILELPTILIFVIIAKLPLKTIFCCRGVCKAFLKLIEDPYFAITHLKEALRTSTAIIVQDGSQVFRPYILEFNYTPKKSPCSSDYQFYNQQIISRQSHGVPLRNINCCFLTNNTVLVSSCHGLLCLYSVSQRKPTYCICNPVTGECITLPHPDCYAHQSGFGFCPKTKQYKVILFNCSASTMRAVALVHTLGTGSWTNIGEAPYPELQETFDCFLEGKYHLITASPEISEKVYSFDRETEKFKPVPMPARFGAKDFSKISWITVGVISGCLCLCYTFGDANFEVLAMQEYGIRESWIKKFSIDINFYSGLDAADFERPIKFLNKGELLFLSTYNTLVSYSPQKGTFRDIKDLGVGWFDAIAHVSSFVSPSSHVSRGGIAYEKIKLERPVLRRCVDCSTWERSQC